MRHVLSASSLSNKLDVNIQTMPRVTCRSSKLGNDSNLKINFFVQSSNKQTNSQKFWVGEYFSSLMRLEKTRCTCVE